MRLLDRYIARQIFFSSIYAIGLIIIVLVLGNVFQEILKELAKRPDLDLFFVLKFIVLVIPISLSLAVPFSFLSAILITFGRLSADSEFISMRMAGLSMARICLPVAVVALFFTAICAWVNLSITPAAKTEMEGMKATLLNLMKREPLLLFPNERVMSELPGYLVYASKENGMLKGIQMIKMEDKSPQAIILAREAKVRVDMEKEDAELVLDMSGVNLMVAGESGGIIQSSQPIFLESAEAGVSIKALKENDEIFKEEPSNISLSGLFRKSSDMSLDAAVRAPYRTELSMRFAFSVSCLTFALIGVPLAVTSQRREGGAGFAISLGIAVVYYAMLTVAEGMGDREELYPHLLVWVPNIVFFTLGTVLFRRLSRR